MRRNDINGAGGVGGEEEGKPGDMCCPGEEGQGKEGKRERGRARERTRRGGKRMRNVREKRKKI